MSLQVQETLRRQMNTWPGNAVVHFLALEMHMLVGPSVGPCHLAF